MKPPDFLKDFFEDSEEGILEVALTTVFGNRELEDFLRSELFGQFAEGQ